MSSKSVSQIQALLQNPKSRNDCLIELAESRYRSRCLLALPYLQDNDSLTRRLAFDCLFECDVNADLEKAVEPLLFDVDSELRISAIEYFVEAKSVHRLGKIEKLLRDEDALVRAYAIWAFSELGDETFVEPIREACNVAASGHELISCSEFLVRAAGRNDEVQSLIRFLNSADAGERSFASAALSRVAGACSKHRRSITDALATAARVERNRGTKTRITHDWEYVSSLDTE